VDFVAGVTSAFLSAATFIVVLWTIGGALTVTLSGSTITIPGFLVIAAIVYAAIASGSIMTIGRSFVQVSEDKNQAEAEYRYALTRVRENGESIALLGGEEEERDGIDKTFTKVLQQWARLAGQHMRTTLVSQGSSLIAPGGSALAVRAKISRRQHDARTGDAGGFRLHHRADRRSAGWSTIIRGSPTGTPAQRASLR
jgi:putative ATP-binding cassette transporter